MTIGVRVNVAERALLDDQAAAVALDVGTYLRQAGLRRRMGGTVPPINVEAWRELARATANLNQIAAHLNGGGRFDERGTARMAQALDALRAEVTALRLDLLGAIDGDEDDEDA